MLFLAENPTWPTVRRNSGCYLNTAKYPQLSLLCVYFGTFSVFLSQLNGAEATPGTYSGSKMAAGRYQRAMQQFTSALQGGGLGTWVRKPPELDHFNISV